MQNSSLCDFVCVCCINANLNSIQIIIMIYPHNLNLIMGTTTTFHLNILFWHKHNEEIRHVSIWIYLYCLFCAKYNIFKSKTLITIWIRNVLKITQTESLGILWFMSVVCIWVRSGLFLSFVYVNTFIRNS